MPNISTTISSHNHKILDNPTGTQQNNYRLCNCRQKQKCPLDGNCLQQSVVYQATVTSDNDKTATETYIGLTEQPFKTRFNGHTSSFKNEKYKNATELSKHIWELKSRSISYNIHWTIIRKAAAYKPSAKRCQLCITEKYYIICRPKSGTLNSRNELASSCRHKNKYLLANYKSKLKD
jgi:hypothetical protein